jgi:SAM-dependent methyltransferase
MSAADTAALEREALAKTWFYRFTLPSGAQTASYDDGALDAIHATRLAMLDAAVARHFPRGLAGATAADLACHQGYFSTELAKRGCRDVLALDARPEHVADATLIARTLGLPQVRPVQTDVHAATPERFGTHALVLCFGLIYHLENPVGALRVARALTAPGGLCLVETQVVPNLAGPVDWGSYRFVKPLMGVFGLIDETAETHGPEMSTTGICLAPSVEGLLWILRKVGFANVCLVEPPADAYEQHRYGKRVMVAATVPAA